MSRFYNTARDATMWLDAETEEKHTRTVQMIRQSPESETDMVVRHAHTVASRYRSILSFVRTTGFSQDIASAATVAGLRALQTWDPALGVPKSAYVWQACLNAGRAATLRWSSPVSGAHRPAAMNGLFRATCEVEGEDGSSYERPELSAENASNRPDHLMEEAEYAAWRRTKARDRLHAILGPGGTEFAIGVWVDGFTTKQVAEAHNTTEREVSKLRSEIRRRIEGDRDLFALWQNALEDEDDGDETDE